jgi:small membrane protein
VTLFQSVFVPICLLLTILVIVRTLRGLVARRSGLFWAGVWITAAILISHPAFTTVAASWFGIGRGADLVLYVAVLAGLGLSLYFYSQHRRLEGLVTTLIRREALSAASRGESNPSNVSPE